MPVTFNCFCGRLMRAADEHVGKRVKCPGCESLNIVPEPATMDRPINQVTQPSAPARAQRVRFPCPCGKIIQARAEHAGKLTRCPACGDKARIPAPARVGKPNDSGTNPKVHPRAAAPPQTVRAPAPQDVVDELEEVDEIEEVDEVDEAPQAGEDIHAAPAEEDEPVRERSKKRKKRKVGGGWVLALTLGGMGLFLLLLLCGGGLFLFFYMRTPDDLKYVPDDAQSFTMARLAELSRLDKGKDQAKLHAGLIGDSVAGTGLEIAEVERLTQVTWSSNGKQLTWTIVLSVSPMNQKKVLGQLFKGGTKEVKYKDQVLVKGDAPDPVPLRPGMPNFPALPGVAPTAACFVSDRILILGEQAALEKALDKYPREKSEGVIANGIRYASRGYQVVSAHTGSGFGFDLGEAPEGRVSASTLNSSNKLDFVEVITFSSSDKAQSAKTKMEDQRKVAVQKLEGNNDELSKTLVRAIRAASISQSGKEVTVSGRVDVSDDKPGALFSFP